MKRLLIITFFTLIFAPSWGVENGRYDVSSDSQFSILNSQDKDSSLHFLRLQGGVGLGLYRDLGASPLTFRGAELCPGIAFEVEKPNWRYQISLDAEGGAYGLRLGTSYIQAYGGVGGLQVAAQHLFYRHDAWQFWAGVALSEHFDIRYNTSLGNANVGVTNYVAPVLSGLAEWHRGRAVLHGSLEVLSFAVMLRPGFAYMDNFDVNIASPTANMFSQYRCYMAGAVGLSTDVGITWRLSKGNRIGLSYLWHYVTSHTDGHLAPHRFEQAAHGIVLDLCFAL